MKQKLCSVFLLTILMINIIMPIFNISIYADEINENSVSNRQADFINFYASSSEVELSMSNLTTQDYYVMFAFMSNFFEPGVTALSDIGNSESKFYKSFASAIGKDSTNSYLLNIMKSFQEDTINGLESGICTLIDSSGSPLTGIDFLQLLVNSVNLGDTFNVDTAGDDNNCSIANEGTVYAYNTPKLKSQKVFFGDTSHVAFDFSSPATRACLQVISAYNSKLFMSENGIQTLDRMFIDAIGNVWGIQVKNETVATTLKNNSSISLKGLISASRESADAVLGSNVYLIIPACLNPSTFSPKITETNKLRMPLMNRFTLGCIIDEKFLEDLKINEQFIPFYSFLNVETFTRYKTSLAIFGVNSMSPYFGNIGGYTKGSKSLWSSTITNWSNKNQDLANFIYDPQLISLDKSVVNGIGQFGTRSYIVFAPNPKSLQGTNNDAIGENTVQDLNNLFGGKDGETKAYTVGGTDYKDFDNKAEDILRLLLYLYTANYLDLNQVSMNFFSDLGSYANDEDPSSRITEKITEDANNTLLGMNSLNLFFTIEGDGTELVTADGSHTYQGFQMDNVKHSFLIENIIKSCNIGTSNIDDYNNVKKGDFTLLDELNKNDKYVKFFKDIVLNNSITDDTYLFDIFNISTDSNENSIIDPNSKDGFYKVYLQPKDFLSVGNAVNGATTKSNIAISKTLFLGDFGVSQVIGYYGHKNDDAKNAYIVADKNSIIPFLLGSYGYSIFTPTDVEEYKTTSDGDYGLNFKLFSSDTETFKVNISTATFEGNKGLTMGIYFGYIVDMLGISIDGETDEKMGQLVCSGFNSVFLPKYSISAKGGDLVFGGDTFGSGLSLDEDTSFEEIQKDLIRRIYALTTDNNNDYRNNLIKNVLEGFILTVHRTITGTWSSDISSVTMDGNNTYKSVAGYIYTPTLEELSFTATLMNNYLKIYILCMIVVIFMLVLMTLLNMRTWQQSMAIGLFMFIAMLFPYVLISNTINISNKISDSIYSDRFDFWALTEHQQSENSLGVIEGLSEKNAFLTLSSASVDNTYLGATGVKIKWMAPKKVDMFKTLYSDKSLSESFVTNIQIFKWLFNSFIYDSEFVDTEVYGSFVYRSYKNIALEGKSYYEWGQNLLNSNNFTTNVSSNLIGNTKIGISQSKVSKLLDESLNEYTINATRGSLNNYIGLFARYDDDFYTVEYDNDRIQDMKYIKVKGFTENSSKIALWGLINSDITQRIVEEENDNTIGIISNLPSASGDYTAFNNASENSIAKAIFLKNTESPYYYFYSVLKEQYQGSDTSFKKALLKPENFRITQDDISGLSETGKRRVSNGAYKDFLDMEGLFSCIIPYLNDSNTYVEDWRNKYGGDIEEYNFEYDVDEKTGEIKEGDMEYQNALARESDAGAEYTNQVKKKNNLNKVWNMYCPWVDSLYSLSVYNKKIEIGGMKKTIANSLNPSDYLVQGRPMFFSEASMELQGYNYKDLTDVEHKIQKVTEKTYKDLMFLVNYYDMSDDVLLSAAAMYATFNFNSEFSENSFLGNDIMLYPQGFELKNFNYDAFMRLALLNSTGETIFASNDLYERVLSKTSIFTGILLLVCDFISCIAIPMIKFVIIIGLLFLGILVCIACVVNPPEKVFDAVCKSLLLPTILFMVLNIAFAWLTSLIVGEGLTAYVGSKTINFATNDPTITMFIMCLLGVAYLYFSIKILKFLIEAYKQFGLTTALAAVGIVGSTIASIPIGGIKALGGGLGAIGKAGIGAATAEEGHRLAGAYEGLHTGTRALIDRRIKERRNRDMLNGLKSAPNSQGLTNNINEKAQNLGDGTESSKKELQAKAGAIGSEKVDAVKEDIKDAKSIRSFDVKVKGSEIARKIGEKASGLVNADRGSSLESAEEMHGYYLSGKDKDMSKFDRAMSKAAYFTSKAADTWSEAKTRTRHLGVSFKDWRTTAYGKLSTGYENVADKVTSGYENVKDKATHLYHDAGATVELTPDYLKAGAKTVGRGIKGAAQTVYNAPGRAKRYINSGIATYKEDMAQHRLTRNERDEARIADEMGNKRDAASRRTEMKAQIKAEHESRKESRAAERQWHQEYRAGYSKFIEDSKKKNRVGDLDA